MALFSGAVANIFKIVYDVGAKPGNLLCEAKASATGVAQHSCKMSTLKKLFQHKDTVAVVAIILLFTKILGFVKFRIIAGMFGAGRELDIFWAAFVIPDTLFNVLVVGSLNAAVIPVFADVLHKKGEEKLVKLFGGVAAVLALLALIAVIVLFVFARPLSSFLVAEGFLGNTLLSENNLIDADLDLLVKLMRIMLLSPLLLGISSVVTAFLQVHKRFFITTLAPFLYNLGFIFGALYFVERLQGGVDGLAWAVVIGSVLHIAIQVPLVVQFIRKHLKIEDFQQLNGKTRFYLHEIGKIFRLAVPRTIAYLGEQFNGVINTIISFSLTPGALSAYRFAFSLHLFPVQIFGGAIAQVALPNFAEYYAKGQLDRFREAFNRALRQTMFVILPSVVILVVLRLPIVRLAYGVGEFDWWDTIVTSWVLALLGFAVIGQAVVAITLRALYAVHETKLPLIAALITVIVNIVGSYYFTNFFSHYLDWRPIVNQVISQLVEGAATDGVTVVQTVGSFWHDLGRWFTTRNSYDAAVGGLGLSLSVAFFVEMVLNLTFLQKRVKVLSWLESFRPILKMSFAALFMGFVMYTMFRIVDLSLDTSRTVAVATLFVVTSSVGGAAYMLACWLLGVRELVLVNRAVEWGLRRFKKIG